MITAPRRPALAAVMLAFLLTIGTAACATPAADDVPPYAAATRNDPKFTNTFRHEFADVDGVKMHYVTGGKGSPVVLLHGWPQTWYGWWPVLPALAEHHTVYAVDLPGLGDSTGSPAGYDKATLARYVHTLIAERLGVRAAAVVGHDLGAYLALFYPQVSLGGTAFGGTVAPRITGIVRAVDVPHAGHWLVEENPEFVTAELLRFLDG
jgi:pimeloyl-ACP methyl ester carboxylesterase